MSLSTLPSPHQSSHQPVDLVSVDISDAFAHDESSAFAPPAPIRVAQVVYRWSRCGLELQLANQIRCFGAGHIRSWIASSMAPEAQVPDLPSDVHVLSYDSKNHASSFRDWLAGHFLAAGTDVVHARGLWMLPDALSAARKAGHLPVIFSFHGFDDASRNVPWWRRRRWRRAMHACDAVVTVSEAARADLARTLSFPEDRIRVILNGVDTEYFHPGADRQAARRRLGIVDECPILLCVGSLMPVKGYDILIQALSRIVRDGRLAPSSARLIIVGTDHLHGTLHEQVGRELGDMDVLLIGGVEDVRSYYAAADALLMPSRSEGLSNVVLEAMACGLPVVASAVGGLPEQVIDGVTGWLVPGNDADGLADAVVSLLNDRDEAERRGRAGRCRVLQQFRLENTARELASLYADVHDTNSRAHDLHSASISEDLRWPLNDDHLHWYAYARVAWWHLLASLHLRPGDNILMPDLICDVMTEPLRLLGLIPRYYTSEPLGVLGPDDLAPHIDARTRAVLAVHYFGLPRNLAEAAAFCREHNLPLIEDASQTMLSRDATRPVGRYGDAVLFSFRKTLGLPHGAGLICNDAGMARALARTPVPLAAPRRDVWRFWIKRWDQRYFGGSWERFIDALRTGRRSVNNDIVTTSSSASNPDPFDRCLVRPGRTARWLAAQWDIHAETRRRRNEFARLAQRWDQERLPGTPLLSALPPKWVPYAFIIEPENADADSLAGVLQEAGLAAEAWPRLPEDVPEETVYRRRVLIRF